MDEKTIELLKSLDRRRAYDTLRRSVLQNPWGTSSEDLHGAFQQAVDAGILTWDEIEAFEES